MKIYDNLKRHDGIILDSDVKYVTGLKGKAIGAEEFKTITSPAIVFDDVGINGSVFSINLWFKLGNNYNRTKSLYLFHLGETNNKYTGMYIYFYNDMITLQSGTSEGATSAERKSYEYGNALPNDNDWHMLTVVIGGFDDRALYLDNILLTPTISGGATTVNYIDYSFKLFGAPTVHALSINHISIDELSIYNKKLTSSEIEDLYGYGTCFLNIPVTGIEMVEKTFKIQPTETQQLTYNIIPKFASNKNVTWSSSNESVATVDEYGIVTGLSEGIVTITATTEDGGFTDTSSGTIKKLITASGGIEYEVGDYKVHAFTTVGNNTFDVEYGGEMDVFIVAGGGSYAGGGGGVIFKRETILDGTYTLSVGAGGVDRGKGGNSTAFGYTANGGGGADNRNGGSGAGGNGTNVYGKGTAGQGNDGGLGMGTSSNYAGGGGAGEKGMNTSATGTPPKGGNGIKEVSINGVVTSLVSMYGNNYGQKVGSDVWFAGGGGGSTNTQFGNGGYGGGTKGVDGRTNGVNSPNNTGGGSGVGGGAGRPPREYGKGGSGIILIRYLKD